MRLPLTKTMKISLFTDAHAVQKLQWLSMLMAARANNALPYYSLARSVVLCPGSVGIAIIKVVRSALTL